MKSLLVVLILNVFLYSSVQAIDCSVCALGGYFTPQNGYNCFPKDSATVFCTCPATGAMEENKPCRLCSRTNPAENVCRSNPKLILCLEENTYGTSYACLCLTGPDPDSAAVTTNSDCDTTVTLSTPRMTTTASSGVSSVCANGGVFYNGVCQCPSGYSGSFCGDKNEPNLCDKIVCKNNGTCAIRNKNGPYEGVCLCHYGTFGDYCELIGTLGYCSAGSCLNGGACIENVIGITRHAYCRCLPGYTGPKCETLYFTCLRVGQFADLTLFEQGKYFECTNVGGTLRIEQKSCPRGLRFNMNANACTYSVTKK